MICLPPNFQYKKWTSARVRVRAFQQQSMTHIVAQGPLATFVDIDTCGLRALNLSWAFQTQARGGLSAEQCTANAQRCFWARVTARQVAAAWDSAVTALSAAAAGLRRLHGPRYGLGGFFSGSPRRQHRNGFMSRAVMGQAWPSG